jgi:predicted small metal-binding protein
MKNNHGLMEKIYRFRCEWAGLDCDFEVDGITREEVLAKVREHARGHDIDVNDPKVKRIIMEKMRLVDRHTTKPELGELGR